MMDIMDLIEMMDLIGMMVMIYMIHHNRSWSIMIDHLRRWSITGIHFPWGFMKADFIWQSYVIWTSYIDAKVLKTRWKYIISKSRLMEAIIQDNKCLSESKHGLEKVFLPFALSHNPFWVKPFRPNYITL